MTIFRIIIIGLLGAMMGVLHAKPFIPSQDDQVLEKLPLKLFQSTTSKKIQSLRRQLKTNPNDWPSVSQLAQYYIELSKTFADPRYMGYAQTILNPWLENSKPLAQALVLRAVIRQNAHDFSGAMMDLDQVLGVQSNHVQANLIKATIASVQGEYSLSIQHCRRLMRRSLILALVCQSTPASLSGNAEISYQMLHQIMLTETRLSKQQLVWAWTSFAEIAWRLGYFEAANLHFQTALQMEVQDYYLLRMYADFLLQQRRPVDVIRLISVDTQNDSLLLRLALAEKITRSKKLSDHVFLLNERFLLNRQRGSAFHKGDEARFHLYLLNQPQEALKLSQQNWRVQREPTDTYILLKSAIAAHDLKTIAEVKRWLTVHGTEDVLIEEILATQEGKNNEI